MADPTPTALHEAALAHLARYAATAAGLVRVLDRRVERWARAGAADAEAVAAARRAVREEVARLVAAGLVDDAAFAAGRARSLARAGRSRRAIAAHLAERGVAAETRAALPDDAETELAAALAFARRRRIAPFGPAADADTRRRALGMFARAGFSQATATAAMATPPDAAQALVNALRQS